MGLILGLKCDQQIKGPIPIFPINDVTHSYPAIRISNGQEPKSPSLYFKTRLVVELKK